MGERHRRYVWYDGNSKQSGGAEASIWQIHLGSDPPKRIYLSDENNSVVTAELYESIPVGSRRVC